MSIKLFKRKASDIWHYSFTALGQRVRQSARTDDYELAEHLAKEHKRTIEHQKVHGIAATTNFAQAAKMYINAGGDPRFLAPLVRYFGTAIITHIKPPQIRAAARKLYPNVKASTQNRNVIVPARAVLNHVLELDGQSIVVKKFPEEQPEERKAANLEWILAFISSCNDIVATTNDSEKRKRMPILAAYVYFVFTTGARQGQAISLTWDNLDLSKARARLVTRKTGRCGPKQKNRWAVLTTKMVAMLANLDKNTKYQRVFDYWDKKQLNRHVDEVINYAGINRLTSHEYGRHGFATHVYIEKKQDDVTTAKAGGWSNANLIRSTYAHSNPDQELMDKIFEVK